MEKLSVKFAGQNDQKGRSPYVRLDIEDAVPRDRLEHLENLCNRICDQFGLAANSSTCISQMGGEKCQSQVYIGFHDLHDDGQNGLNTVRVVAQRIALELKKEMA